MGARRVDQLQDLSLVVRLDAARCLDTADFVARHCGRYGIHAELEFHRHHGSRHDGRHYVLCHHAGTLHPSGVALRASTPLWVMHVQITREHVTVEHPTSLFSRTTPRTTPRITPGNNQRSSSGTNSGSLTGRGSTEAAPTEEAHRVSLLVRPPRSLLRFSEASRAARAARQYQELLALALRSAEEDRRRHRQDPDTNVISLRPFIDLPPLISA
ncbi:MAG: hypothetical protein ACKV2O_09460 [Acidimicrobiales bacterium]